MERGVGESGEQGGPAVGGTGGTAQWYGRLRLFSGCPSPPISLSTKQSLAILIPTPTNTLQDELQLYLDSPREPAKDLIQWWTAKSSAYPRLS